MTRHGRRLGGASRPSIEIVSREPISGGFSAATKERVRVVIAEQDQRVERAALLKHTSATEVSGLHAASEVPLATAIPRVIDFGIDDGRDWILIPFYEGSPAEAETIVPNNVIESLARMHVHYLTRPTPDQLPVVDPLWWQEKCAVAIERLAVLGRPAHEMIAQVAALQGEPRVLHALEELPRTLLHGDVHRNNVIVDQRGIGHLIDWGGSLVGAPALDIVNLGEPGSDAYKTYADMWETLTGQNLDNPAWRRCYLVATVCINVKYVAFAAKLLGDHKARSMLQRASEALEQLEAV